MAAPHAWNNRVGLPSLLNVGVGPLVDKARTAAFVLGFSPGPGARSR